MARGTSRFRTVVLFRIRRLEHLLPPSMLGRIWIQPSRVEASEVRRLRRSWTISGSMTLVSEGIMDEPSDAYLATIWSDPGIDDTDPPEVSLITVAANRTTVGVALDEPCTVAGSVPTISMSSGAATLTHSSGSGTDSQVYTASRTSTAARPARRRIPNPATVSRILRATIWRPSPAQPSRTTPRRPRQSRSRCGRRRVAVACLSHPSQPIAQQRCFLRAKNNTSRLPAKSAAVVPPSGTERSLAVLSKRSSP